MESTSGAWIWVKTMLWKSRKQLGFRNTATRDSLGLFDPVPDPDQSLSTALTAMEPQLQILLESTQWKKLWFPGGLQAVLAYAAAEGVVRPHPQPGAAALCQL